MSLAGTPVALPQPEPEAEPPPEPPPPPVDAPPTALDDESFDLDEVVVSASEDDLMALAAAWGVEVTQAPGASGSGALAVPAGWTADAFLDAVRDDPRVDYAGPQAFIEGVSGDHASLVAGDLFRAQQWHLDRIVPPPVDPELMHTVVVAVLDTGVAYTPQVPSTEWMPAVSLADNPVVAPWDFVDDDAFPYDEHWHGTHIASLIGSDGPVMGVAPQVSLMPLRVLDAHNRGTELALVDALHHAVDHGADVINMSLAFGPSYVPSRPLMDALDRAAEAGIVLVAAGGNVGGRDLAWPAASPRVIAAGAACRDGASKLLIAPYTHRSPALTMLAPGGCIDEDEDGDGVPDGLLAETITPGDPSDTALYLAAGSSQAAALLSGAAAQLLAHGAYPEEVSLLLQDNANSHSGDRILDGRGGGNLKVTDAVNGLADTPLTRDDFHVAVMPWLAEGGLLPRARVTVVNDLGERVDGVHVAVRVVGATASGTDCTTAGGGSCTVTGLPFSGPTTEAWWSFRVEAVLQDGLATYPTPMFFASSAVDALMDDEEPLPLAFRWGAETVDGEAVAPAWVFTDQTAGAGTGPVALVLHEDVLPADATTDAGEIEGTGISTSPFGLYRLRLRSGLLGASSDGDVSALVVDGAGISTSPFGLRQALGGTSCAGCGDPTVVVSAGGSSSTRDSRNRGTRARRGPASQLGGAAGRGEIGGASVSTGASPF